MNTLLLLVIRVLGWWGKFDWAERLLSYCRRRKPRDIFALHFERRGMAILSERLREKIVMVHILATADGYEEVGLVLDASDMESETWPYLALRQVAGACHCGLEEALCHYHMVMIPEDRGDGFWHGRVWAKTRPLPASKSAPETPGVYILN